MNYWASDMEAFEYSAPLARVIFGYGTLPRVTFELNVLVFGVKPFLVVRLELKKGINTIE
jgi:hypothetical protein